MPYFGRRTIYIVGMAAMCVVLMLIGVLNVWTDRDSIALTQASLSLLWTFIFQLSAGQLGWALPAEMGSTRLRCSEGWRVSRSPSQMVQPWPQTLQQREKKSQ